MSRLSLATISRDVTYKSLCYACLPGVFDALYSSFGSVVVVISPLTAIIKDQVCSVCVMIEDKDKGLSV